MEEFSVVLPFFHMKTMPLPSLPLVIDPFSSVLVFPRQDTGLLQPKPLGGITRAVVPAPEWLLCGKSLSSQHSKQSHLKGLGIALCSWQGHAKQQAWTASTILGNYSPWWPKSLRSLEPPFKAGAQPGLCHCQITVWQQNKPSVTAVNQPGFRLLRQHLVWGSLRRFDVCCGSWWVGAPGGVLGAALSFSISHLASPEPSMASHMLSLIRSVMTPEVKRVEGCSSVGVSHVLVNTTSVTWCTLTSSWETIFWPIWAFF